MSADCFPLARAVNPLAIFELNGSEEEATVPERAGASGSGHPCNPITRSLARGTRCMSRPKGRAEEVSFIPRRGCVMLGHLISHEEIHDRPFGSGIVIDGLVHVVERSVVAGDQPFLDQLETIDFWIGRLDSIRDIH